MLDVHIIVSSDTSREWVAQCLDSIEAAAARALFAAGVHVVPASGPHIGRDRPVGFGRPFF